jgi:hypothetical protein
VATDPFTYTFGLVPPPAVSLDDAFDLQDVINVSEEARVVTQSSPPFCVVVRCPRIGKAGACENQSSHHFRQIVRFVPRST